MMPKQYKVNACLTFVLAVLFYLFWQISKHQPALSQVNAFAEDPYDAVGRQRQNACVWWLLVLEVHVMVESIRIVYR